LKTLTLQQHHLALHGFLVGIKGTLISSKTVSWFAKEVNADIEIKTIALQQRSIE